MHRVLLRSSLAVFVLSLSLAGAAPLTAAPPGGSYTVTQLNPIDHPTPDESEEEVSFTVGYQVTDGDGDTVDGTLSIDVDDDTPEILSANSAVHLDDETASSTHAAPNLGGTGDYNGTTPAPKLR